MIYNYVLQLGSIWLSEPISKLLELQLLLRQVIYDSSYDGRYKAQKKGLFARLMMMKLSPSYVVNKMIDRLRYHASIRGWNYE